MHPLATAAMALAAKMGQEVVSRAKNAWDQWSWDEYISDDLEKYPVTSRVFAKVPQAIGAQWAEMFDQGPSTRTRLTRPSRPPQASEPEFERKRPSRRRKKKVYRIDRTGGVTGDIIGQVYAEDLGKKVNVIAKKGETPSQAKARVKKAHARK